MSEHHSNERRENAHRDTLSVKKMNKPTLQTLQSKQVNRKKSIVMSNRTARDKAMIPQQMKLDFTISDSP